MRLVSTIALLAAVWSAGCGGILAVEGTDCSPQNPSGICPAGRQCVAGTCIHDTYLEPCSATNPLGSCDAGETCDGEVCVTAEAPCGPGEPFGFCPPGHVCRDEKCRPMDTFCSSTSPTGACPLTSVCRDGVCEKPECGNEEIEPGEDCEGFDLGGTECSDIGFTQGFLTCRDDCKFDTSFCSLCGDGVIEFGEECEPGVTTDVLCEWFNYPVGSGSPACTDTCELDTTTCGGSCGDGVKSPTEECDASDPGFSTDCSTVPGFTGGTVACVDCTLVTTACTYCGDGATNGNEECDGALGVPATCKDVHDDYPDTDAVTCDDFCRLDTSACGSCGDGIISSAEQCDPGDGAGIPVNLGGKDCTYFGFDTPGDLRCTSTCRFSFTHCGDGCEPAGAPCTADAQCCGRHCRTGIQGGGGVCMDASGCYADEQNCEYAGQCCSLFCNGEGKCAPGSCQSAGDSCAEPYDCCGDVCESSKCAAVGGCLPAGESCSQNSQCCTQNCTLGKCPLYPLCRVQGEICRDDMDCCTRKCEVENGSMRCQELEATFITAVPTSGETCLVIGEMCSQNGACCSNACRLVASTNPSTNRCEFLGGCRPVGEICSRDTDCCSYRCRDTVDGVMRCDTFRGCGEAPQVDPLCPEAGFPGCATKGGKLQCCARRGEICQTKNDCCEGTRCEVAVGGAKRCLRTGACYSAGEICAVPEDCCGGLCVQHSDGFFRCGVEDTGGGDPGDPGGSCVPDYGTCSSSLDCCNTSALCFDFGAGPLCYPDTGGG